MQGGVELPLSVQSLSAGEKQEVQNFSALQRRSAQPALDTPPNTPPTPPSSSSNTLLCLFVFG